MKNFKLLIIKKMDLYKKFTHQWKIYAFQISIAMLSIFIAMLVIKMQNIVMIASLGATAFFTGVIILFLLHCIFKPKLKNLV